MKSVASGAALLDCVRPGWEEMIDLATLDVLDPCQCVLAHVFGHYLSGLVELGLAVRHPDGAVQFEAERSITYGFSGVFGDETLTAAWVALVADRRAGDEEQRQWAARAARTYRSPTDAGHAPHVPVAQGAEETRRPPRQKPA